jgi:flavin reductase (DIM6/NTAB) family NADH-FMN oxidoreductase RutF
MKAEISERAFRDALGRFATGVAIVTAEIEGMLLGTTVSSFNSVSLSPPLVLFSLARRALGFARWQEVEGFGVTLLDDTQSDLSTRFARGGSDKWSGLVPCRGPAGLPLIPHGLARFECQTHARYDGGDHEIIVGRVISFAAADGEPLLFFGGRYRRIEPEPPVAPLGEANLWLHAW